MTFFTLPYSQGYKKSHEPVKIKVLPVLSGKKVKEIRIIPKSRAKFFEVQYTYKCECVQRDLNKNNALALDFGVDNLVTAASSDGKSFLIDGRRLKSANRLYNKKIAKLQGILDKQFPDEHRRSKRMDSITRHRNAYVNDYMSKAAKLVIDYCIANDIGTLVVGYNVTFQLKSGMGHRNNQNFVMIPYGKLRSKLEYLCKLNGISYVEQEESYTSKASFFDRDEIPVYNDDNPKTYVFSGRRVSRGLYMSSSGYAYNADVNGALNILRKSNVVDLSVLYDRGDVDTPARIRVA